MSLCTPLIAAARARGLRAAEGLGMLLHQAAPAFERWFGQPPVVSRALRALVEADVLARRQEEAMIVAGLTGSIAMGKSTVAAMFAALGAPVFDADEAVRDFYAGKGAESVEAVFPGVASPGVVDRGQARSGARRPGALMRLESLVHPAVAGARSVPVRTAAEGRRLAIVDVPLLFETGGDSASIWSSSSARRRRRKGRGPWRARACRPSSMRLCAADIGCGKAAPRPFRYRHGR